MLYSNRYIPLPAIYKPIYTSPHSWQFTNRYIHLPAIYKPLYYSFGSLQTAIFLSSILVIYKPLYSLSAKLKATIFFVSQVAGRYCLWLVLNRLQKHTPQITRIALETTNLDEIT